MKSPARWSAFREDRPPRLLFWAALPAILALLGWYSWLNRSQVSTDAIGYLRTAEYIAAANWDLMVTGYWSPLVSWLMVPALAAGLSALPAARIAMGISALVLWFGCVRVFRAFGLGGFALLAGIWVTGLASVAWAIRQIGGDVLVAGLICLACSVVLDPRWATARRPAVLAGVLWGLGFLAKTIALPMAALVVPGFGLLWWSSGRATAREVARAGGTTLAVCALVALPWVTVLSLKYGRLTYSTVPPIAHAIRGFGDENHYHPSFRTLHKPEPGRCASWEDPTFMPYRYWSPFASRRNFVHQLRIIRGNFWNTVATVRSFDLLALGGIGCLLALVPFAGKAGPLPAVRKSWALVPVLTNCALTLPVFAGTARYYYAIYPFLWLLAWDFLERVTERLPFRPMGNRAAIAILCFSFLVPLEQVYGHYFRHPNRTAHEAHVLAERLLNSGKEGPVAGEGTLTLWVAYFLKSQYYGQQAKAAAADYRGCGARLVMAERGKPLARDLARDPLARDLDPILFRSAAEAAAFPQVFEVLAPGAAPVPPGAPPGRKDDAGAEEPAPAAGD